mmetsp:Transcript_695/g.1124  ORF Transcript_695/g.1124 Transcript_695/m.1124 type:complete len:83 (+) Transcript_695:163-411(+)
MLLQHDGYITWAILHGSVLFGTKANDTVPADARLIDGYPVDSRCQRSHLFTSPSATSNMNNTSYNVMHRCANPSSVCILTIS